MRALTSAAARRLGKSKRMAAAEQHKKKEKSNKNLRFIYSVGSFEAQNPQVPNRHQFVGAVAWPRSTAWGVIVGATGYRAATAPLHMHMQDNTPLNKKCNKDRGESSS